MQVLHEPVVPPPRAGQLGRGHLKKKDPRIQYERSKAVQNSNRGMTLRVGFAGRSAGAARRPASAARRIATRSAWLAAPAMASAASWRSSFASSCCRCCAATLRVSLQLQQGLSTGSAAVSHLGSPAAPAGRVVAPTAPARAAARAGPTAAAPPALAAPGRPRAPPPAAAVGQIQSRFSAPSLRQKRPVKTHIAPTSNRGSINSYRLELVSRAEPCANRPPVRACQLVGRWPWRPGWLGPGLRPCAGRAHVSLQLQ